MAALRDGLKVWALSEGVNDALLERLGDCRRAADGMRAGVGVLVVGAARSEAGALLARGADRVCFVASTIGLESRVSTAEALLREHGAGLVMADGDCGGREWAARLAARLGCALVSPALGVTPRGGMLEVSGLDGTGRFMRSVRVAAGETVLVTLRAGVGETVEAAPSRSGELIEMTAIERPEPVRRVRLVPADPAVADIRHAERLVAGGRGVGGKDQFDTLRRFAARIGAGVAASRMAVDMGWIGQERQVGQTGKTVAPDLYIACGISGASHHLEGISGARHVVAINTDPEAPIFRVAHLGLVADLHEVLERAAAGVTEA